MAWTPCPFFSFPLAPLAVPSLLSLLPPLYFPSLTWRPPAVTNCPPSYQVSCRLTPLAPPFTQSTDPFQAPPRTPIAQRLTTTTLRLIRFYCAEQDWTVTEGQLTKGTHFWFGLVVKSLVPCQIVFNFNRLSIRFCSTYVTGGHLYSLRYMWIIMRVFYE